MALNFNKAGDTHTTVIGGFFSIFIKLAMTVYIIINLVKLITYNGDTISTTFLKQNLDEAGPIVYDASNLLVFWCLTDTRGTESPLMIDDPKFFPNEAKKEKPFLSVEYFAMHTDWYNYENETEDKKFKTFTKAKGRMCEEKDFCLGKECTENLRKEFADWEGISMVCPDT